MSLLAIDPGSEHVAFAYFVDGILQRTDLIRAGGARLERLHYIGEQLTTGSRTRGWQPDVVAVEEGYVGRNAVTALRMANTVGYLERVIYEFASSGSPRRVSNRVFFS